ncbi:hypothetical protein JYK21_01535 [Ralstonia pickettii]|nr:hypothetical protein [Ralstonia pickettii]
MLDPVFVIPVTVVILLSIILAIYYQGKPKVDKGFVFSYHKLTYRRKMIRSLTSLPIAIAAVVVIYLYTEWSLQVNILAGLGVFILLSVEFFYNYMMWRKKERSNE